MKRLMLAALVLILGGYAYAQGFVSRCGKVQNKSDFRIVVQVKAIGGGLVTIGPHSTGIVCAGR
jgi:hypothetical protein